MMDTFNGALRLNRGLFQSMRDVPDVVRRGMLVLLLVGLLVGGVNGVQNLLNTMNVDRTLATVRAQIEENLELQALLNPTPERRAILQLVNANLDTGFAIAHDVLSLPTTLPRPLVALLQGLATLVSTPLSYLSSLLIWVVFTHIAARWLGGQGNIQQMIGLGALSVAPHALDALAFIPVIGGAIDLIAGVWGLVILGMATSVVHRLDSTRAAVAVLLFPLVGIVLGLLSYCALLAFAIAAAVAR